MSPALDVRVGLGCLGAQRPKPNAGTSAPNPEPRTPNPERRPVSAQLTLSRGDAQKWTSEAPVM